MYYWYVTCFYHNGSSMALRFKDDEAEKAFETYLGRVHDRERYLLVHKPERVYIKDGELAKAPTITKPGVIT